MYWLELIAKTARALSISCVASLAFNVYGRSSYQTMALAEVINMSKDRVPLRILSNQLNWNTAWLQSAPKSYVVTKTGHYPLTRSKADKVLDKLITTDSKAVICKHQMLNLNTDDVYTPVTQRINNDRILLYAYVVCKTNRMQICTVNFNFQLSKWQQ